MTTSSRGFWIGFLIGSPILAVGVIGMIDNAGETKPAELVRWLVGGAVVHDGVVVPIVCALGIVGASAAPRWLWRPARWALASTALLVVVSRPFVAGYGRSATNPSVLPRDYGAGVAVAIAAVWAVAAVLAALTRRRGAR